MNSPSALRAQARRDAYFELRARGEILTRPERQKLRPAGFVYFVRADNGEVKIGYATDVQRRLGELQRASAAGLELLGCRPGRRADEAALHAHFARHRLHGEWFSPSTDLLATAWGFGIDGEPKPFTLRQAAEIMRTTPAMVRREIALGTLKCGRDSKGEPLVSAEQIEDWIWHDLPKEQRV